MQKISLNCRPTSHCVGLFFYYDRLFAFFCLCFFSAILVAILDFRIRSSEVRLLTDFGHITSDIILRRSADFGIRTLNGLLTDFQLQISDFQLQTSNFRCYNWTSLSALDNSLNFSLHVRLRTDVKLRTQKLGQFICHTTKTNIHM